MSKKLKIVITRLLTDKPNSRIAELAKTYELKWWKEPTPIPRETFLKWSKGASGILCMLSEKIDEELLDAAGPKLKVISTMSVGYEHMDLDALSKRNVMTGHTSGVLTDAVADLTLALLLALMRRIPEAHQIATSSQVRTWAPTWMLGTQITGKTVGIFGLGRIGMATARRIYGFSPTKIIYTTRTPIKVETIPVQDQHIFPTLISVDFHELLTTSDILIICTDSNPSTHHLFNNATFKQMKPTSLLVNTSRGAIVDTDALVEALDTHMIYGAALDVTEPEPLPPNHPLITNFGNRVIVAPHIGSATLETRNAMGCLALDNLEAGLKQIPLPAPIFP